MQWGVPDWSQAVKIAYEDYRRQGFPEQNVATKYTNGDFIAPCDGLWISLGGDFAVRGILNGQQFNVHQHPQDNSHIYINATTAMSSPNPWFVPLAKGDVLHFWADVWFAFVPWKGQGFDCLKTYPPLT